MAYSIYRDADFAARSRLAVESAVDDSPPGQQLAWTDSVEAVRVRELTASRATAHNLAVLALVSIGAVATLLLIAAGSVVELMAAPCAAVATSAFGLAAVIGQLRAPPSTANDEDEHARWTRVARRLDLPGTPRRTPRQPDMPPLGGELSLLAYRSVTIVSILALIASGAVLAVLFLVGLAGTR